MKKNKTVYFCSKCGNNCHDKACYTCDSSRYIFCKKISISPMQKKWELNKISLQMSLSNRNKYDVLFSYFGDCPGICDELKMSSKKLTNLLKKHDFIFNGINAVGENLRACIGIALIEPYMYKNNEIYGLFIFTDY